jgi:hypothetical protein
LTPATPGNASGRAPEAAGEEVLVRGGVRHGASPPRPPRPDSPLSTPPRGTATGASWKTQLPPGSREHGRRFRRAPKLDASRATPRGGLALVSTYALRDRSGVPPDRTPPNAAAGKGSKRAGPWQGWPSPLCDPMKRAPLAIRKAKAASTRILASQRPCRRHEAPTSQSPATAGKAVPLSDLVHVRDGRCRRALCVFASVYVYVY